MFCSKTVQQPHVQWHCFTPFFEQRGLCFQTFTFGIVFTVCGTRYKGGDKDLCLTDIWWTSVISMRCRYGTAAFLWPHTLNRQMVTLITVWIFFFFTFSMKPRLVPHLVHRHGQSIKQENVKRKSKYTNKKYLQQFFSPHQGHHSSFTLSFLKFLGPTINLTLWSHYNFKGMKVI